EETMDRLSAAGFTQYEISNHARPGQESQHNHAYWCGADYLGFGPSAFSTVGGRRWQNVPDSAQYAAQVLAGTLPVSFREELDPPLKRREAIMFGLRTSRGVAADALRPWGSELQKFHEL